MIRADTECGFLQIKQLFLALGIKNKTIYELRHAVSYEKKKKNKYLLLLKTPQVVLVFKKNVVNMTAFLEQTLNRCD